MEGRVVETLRILRAVPASLAARGSRHLATAGHHPGGGALAPSRR